MTTTERNSTTHSSTGDRERAGDATQIRRRGDGEQRGCSQFHIVFQCTKPPGWWGYTTSSCPFSGLRPAQFSLLKSRGALALRVCRKTTVCPQLLQLT